MQAWLIELAIRQRRAVLALALLLAAWGLWSLGGARYDVFPEFAPPEVGIQAEAPGLTPKQVETLVTRPLEAALDGAPGVRSLRSTSIQGLAVLTVLFDSSSDIYRDRQVVAERLASAAADLPRGVKPPGLTPLTSSTSTVLVIGLTSAERSPMALRDAAQWLVRPRLLAVPGIAKVAIFGGGERSIQIRVHPDELIRYGLGIDDVLAAARRATGVRGAGYVDTANQRILLRTRGQSTSAAEIGRSVLASRGGASLPLSSVADVKVAPEPAIGGATIDGVPGVVVRLAAQFGSNTVEVTRAVEAALAELRPALKAQGIVLHPDLFRPANFIATATGNVRNSLLLGGLMVIAVVLLFLFNLRSAAIACAAIPLSLLAAVLVLERMGATLNTMTLGGLAISIGVVVDDAVVGVENVVRRLRENARLAAPRPAARVVLDACLEVRGAVVYATFAVILVVLPVMALSGIAGRLFGPLGLAYALAVIASLVVALTVTPALAMALLARRGLPQRDPPVMRWTRSRYEALLHGAARRPRLLIAAAIVFTLGACAALPFFGASFIPQLKEGHYIVHMAAVPGTSLAASMRLGERVDRALLALPEVRSVAQQAGRAELGDDTWGPNYSEFEVDLKPGLSGDASEQALDHIRKALAGFVGVNFSANTFLTERIDETLSGSGAAVAVKIFGNDLDALDRTAQRIARVLRGVPGAEDVQLASPPGLPQVTIALRRAQVARWGFDPVDVLDRIRAAYQGEVVGQVYQGNRVYNVMAILDPATRDDIAKLRALPLRSPGGVYVPLGRLARVYLGAGRYQVMHEGARRLQTVSANVSGPDVASFVDAARRAIAAKVKLPPGAYLEYTGAAQAERRSRQDLLADSLLAAAGIVLLLSFVTGHWRNLLLVLANLPFALAGGVLAVLATGGELSLGALVGFVALFGISLRNSILMIDHYERLVGVEGLPWNLATAVRGAADRLTAILMTSLVTGIGVLPLALGMEAPGREIEGAMAVVILGGLLTSMALNLLVLPTLALRYGRFEAKT